MAEQFYSILTSIGKAKIANANALGNKLNLTTLVLGDGNGKYYNATENQEALVNEVWKGNISSITTDSKNPNWIVIETIIAGNVGGFFIREVGIFDDEGSLIAIGKYPETYKPVISDGSTKDLIIRMILEVSNSANVTLKIDPAIIMATKKDVEVLDNKIENIEVPVTKVNNKLGDVILKAEDIKANNDKTIEENLQEVTSQMAEITKQVESIEVTAEKTTLDSDKFTSKNVKAGMEELFTFADNGKKNIATVIGSPLSNSDTFDNMKGKIQTMKNTFASNLTAKGQNSSGSDTLNNLINKVNAITSTLHPYGTDLQLLNQSGRDTRVIQGDEAIEFTRNRSNSIDTLYKQVYTKNTSTLLSSTSILSKSSYISCITAFTNKKIGLTINNVPHIVDFSGNILSVASNCSTYTAVHHNGTFLKVEYVGEGSDQKWKLMAYDFNKTLIGNLIDRYAKFYYETDPVVFNNYDLNTYLLFVGGAIHAINYNGTWRAKQMNWFSYDQYHENLIGYLFSLMSGLTKTKYIN